MNAHNNRGEGRRLWAFTPNECKQRDDGVTEIYLSGGRVALIDTEDYEIVQGFRWHFDQGVVLAQLPKSVGDARAQMYLRTLIAGNHCRNANGDNLDCRRSNLVSRYTTNEFVHREDGTTVVLIKGQECLIDTVDHKQVRHFCWYVDRGVAVTTARASGMKKTVFMHTMLVPDSRHANGNKLDNRRSNLVLKGTTVEYPWNSPEYLAYYGRRKHCAKKSLAFPFACFRDFIAAVGPRPGNDFYMTWGSKPSWTRRVTKIKKGSDD